MILLLVLACNSQEAATAPTWSDDVRPIVQNRCASCHNDSGSAHFPLDTYATFQPLAGLALNQMETGAMPPWPADPDCRHYEDERLLADGELETVRAWVEAGTPQGDPDDDAPYVEPASTFSPTDSASVPGYLPDDAEPDDWRCFVLDELSSSDTRYLHGTQVVPGNALVHHVLVYALPGSQRDALQEADAEDDAPGYTCFGGPTPYSTTGGANDLSSLSGGFPNQIGGWVPGGVPASLPEGLSIRVDADSVIVMQVHYNTLELEPTPDTSELLLELGTEPTDWLVTTHPVAIPDIEIPAGDDDVVFTRAYPNYGDPLTIRTIMAHMHTLGVQQTVRVNGADGSDTCLLDVPDWDFNWQQTYVLQPDQEVVVGTGDALELSCHYDNSAENQPYVNGEQQPPRDVAWGESTLDEMCLAYFTDVKPYTPPEDPDAAACEGTEDCMAACGSEPELDCLLSCPEADFDCFTCAVQGAIGCGASSCAADFTAARECLFTCAGASIMLGGNVGDCMNAECPDQYADIQSCVDPILASGTCDEALETCGVEVGG